MKIIFLGTNGWYTNDLGDTPCILIDSKDRYVIFDAGNGLYKIDEYITENKPISLFISHFHLDHTVGFHVLTKFNFSQGIDIYMATGRKKDFETLVNIPFTVPIHFDKKNIQNLRTEIRLHELSIGDHDIGFPVQIQKLAHAYENHGFRIILDEKTIVYSGDTSVTETEKKLAQHADILIHECSDVIPKNLPWGHVDATQAAELAKEARVKQLILTHFNPVEFSTYDLRDLAAQKAQKIFPNTIAARDGMEINF